MMLRGWVLVLLSLSTASAVQFYSDIVTDLAPNQRFVLALDGKLSNLIDSGDMDDRECIFNCSWDTNCSAITYEFADRKCATYSSYEMDVPPKLTVDRVAQIYVKVAVEPGTCAMEVTYDDLDSTAAFLQIYFSPNVSVPIIEADEVIARIPMDEINTEESSTMSDGEERGKSTTEPAASSISDVSSTSSAPQTPTTGGKIRLYNTNFSVLG